jgi:hypothetical protein
VRDARLPVRLESVDLRAEVVGHAVSTRVELVFRNPNDRVLEGELQFPLREGQLVTGFALDINGELRPAVPVEKAKGQQVFEDVIRARVDPALLEVTQGNNYKLRVYPLPPQGTRRVVLNLSQTLGRRRARWSCRSSSPTRCRGSTWRCAWPTYRPPPSAPARPACRRRPSRAASPTTAGPSSRCTSSTTPVRSGLSIALAASATTRWWPRRPPATRPTSTPSCR